MDTVLLQINDEKAYRLIEDLEALDNVRYLKRKTEALNINFPENSPGR